MAFGESPVEGVGVSGGTGESGRNFWRGKRVFLTGHTGFKGSWLSLWLSSMGAMVSGYALSPPTDPSLYALAGVDSLVSSILADVRDAGMLARSLAEARPEVVFHMAAQPLVRESYRIPVETYATNVMGTVHLFEAVRGCEAVRAVVNVTTDKCYENREWVWGYRENEPLGGYDPYSSSKACSELVTSAYRRSFLAGGEGPARRASVASARAGNVIGGTTSVDGPVTVVSFTLAGDPTVYTAGQTATITGVGTLVINTDGTYVKVKGEKVGLQVVVDDQTGDLLGLDLIVSEEKEEVLDLVRQVAAQVEHCDFIRGHRPVAACLAHVFDECFEVFAIALDR